MVNKETLQTLTNYLNSQITPKQRKVSKDFCGCDVLSPRVNPGDNLDFLACYLYVHGPTPANALIKALCAHNKIDSYSRGQYTSYFYYSPYRSTPKNYHYTNRTALWRKNDNKRNVPYTITALGIKRVFDFLNKQ